MELYGLVSIVDDQFFGDETTFKTMYGGARPDILTLNSLKTRITPIYKRHLRRDVQEAGHVSFTRRMATTFDFESSDTETELYEQGFRLSAATGFHRLWPEAKSARHHSGPQDSRLFGRRHRRIFGEVRERLESQQVADISTVEDADDTAELADELDEAAALDDEADKPAPRSPAR